MVRSCVGCRETGSPSELVRVVLGPDGAAVPDLGGGAFGRGAWLHPRKECIKRALPRGLSHALRAPVTSDASAFVEMLGAAAERRAIALFRAAARARKAALGTTSVKEAAGAGELRLVVVAADARAAAEAPAVTDAVKRGRAVAFGSKATLGAIFDRDELAVIGILDDGLAEAIARAVKLSELGRSAAGAHSLAMSEVG